MPPAQFVSKRIKSLSGFTQWLAKVYTDIDDVLFRGQREDWPLLPKIARIRLRPRTKLLETEQRLLYDFKLQALSFLDRTPESDWDWLSVAQHYGMATRLLDWTSNPLAALWFAVEKPPASPQAPNRSYSPAVVWGFAPSANDHVKPSSATSPFSGGRTKVFRPKHIDRRIVAQSGWFTVHKYIQDKKKFIPLNKQSRYKPALTKIIVPADCFSEIRYDLDRCGVNAASMLTDLVGLCHHIEWFHSLLDDEFE
jgi:FRG domain-containing protein